MSATNYLSKKGVHIHRYVISIIFNKVKGSYAHNSADSYAMSHDVEGYAGGVALGMTNNEDAAVRMMCAVNNYIAKNVTGPGMSLDPLLDVVRLAEAKTSTDEVVQTYNFAD